MSNPINKKLFEDIKKKIELESGTLWGRQHPVNVLINLQDEIISSYDLWLRITSKKRDAEKTLKTIDNLLEGNIYD